MGEDTRERVRAQHRGEDLDWALHGCSGVCLLFGPRPPFTDLVCAESTRAILAGMARHGIRRIVCATGGMIGHYPANRTWPFQRAAIARQRSHPKPLADRLEQEELLLASNLDWTVVKPRLTDGKGRRRPRAGPDVRVGLLSAVTRSALAAFLVDELTRPRFVRQVVFIKG